MLRYGNALQWKHAAITRRTCPHTHILYTVTTDTVVRSDTHTHTIKTKQMRVVWVKLKVWSVYMCVHVSVVKLQSSGVFCCRPPPCSLGELYHEAAAQWNTERDKDRKWDIKKRKERRGRILSRRFSKPLTCVTICRVGFFLPGTYVAVKVIPTPCEHSGVSGALTGSWRTRQVLHKLLPSAKR